MSLSFRLVIHLVRPAVTISATRTIAQLEIRMIDPQRLDEFDRVQQTNRCRDIRRRFEFANAATHHAGNERARIEGLLIEIRGALFSEADQAKRAFLLRSQRQATHQLSVLGRKLLEYDALRDRIQLEYENLHCSLATGPLNSSQ